MNQNVHDEQGEVRHPLGNIHIVKSTYYYLLEHCRMFLTCSDGPDIHCLKARGVMLVTACWSQYGMVYLGISVAQHKV